MAAASPAPPAQKTRRQRRADLPLCGADTRTGKPCQRKAGSGTTHIGIGRCSNHGGNAPGGAVKAAREQAELLGAELHMEPHDAILLSMRVEAQWFAHCRWRVRMLDLDGIVVEHEKTRTEYAPHVEWDDDADEISRHGVTVERTVEKSTDARMHIFVREMHQSGQRLANLAKMAIDAGIAQRQVEIEERVATAVLDAHYASLEDAGIEITEKVIEATERRFQLINGGLAA